MNAGNNNPQNQMQGTGFGTGTGSGVGRQQRQQQNDQQQAFGRGLQQQHQRNSSTGIGNIPFGSGIISGQSKPINNNNPTSQNGHHSTGGNVLVEVGKFTF
jgi:hypothetical protein